MEKLAIPTRMINLTNIDKTNFSPKLKSYLANDYDKNNNQIRNRYKCCNHNIEDIIKFVDCTIFDDVPLKTFEFLRSIRQKYYKRRLKS